MTEQTKQEYAAWRAAATAKDAASAQYHVLQRAAAAQARRCRRASGSEDQAAYESAWDAYQVMNAKRESYRRDVYAPAVLAEADAWTQYTEAVKTATRWLSSMADRTAGTEVAR